MKITKFAQFYSVVLLLFVGLCSWQSHAMDVENFLKFGATQPSNNFNSCRTFVSQSSSGCVVFAKPFAQGQIPLVFIMPTISANNPNNDGPASIYITNINRFGFTWEQRQPPRSSQSIPMRDVHWLAITPGAHTFPNGQELFAGTAQVNSATNLNRSDWTTVTNDAVDYDAFMTQLQTDNNDDRCWVTSVSQRVQRNGLVNGDVNLETSKVFYSSFFGNRCTSRRSFFFNGHLDVNEETVAYLGLKIGSGIVDYNDSKRLRFQFGNGSNLQFSAVQNLRQQCNYTTPLTGFSSTPFLIAKKITRKGGDGGWLRRCRLNQNQVSVVVDEDTYGADRRHTREEYSFAAFELIDKQQSLIHHFEMQYSDSPFTCKPEPIAIRACADQSCNTLYQGAVTATLSPNISSAFGGWLIDGNRVSQVNFTAGRAMVDMSYYSTEAIRIGISSSSPQALTPTLCKKGNGAASTQACLMDFSGSGFIFSIDDEYANKSQTVLVEAKRLDNQGRCVPLFRNKHRWVEFSSKYIEPSAPLNTANVTVNGQPISKQANNPSELRLRFNGQGQASINVNYPEAGKVELNLQFQNNRLQLKGSDQFVRSPVGFCFKPSESKGEYKGGFDANSAFKKAGEAFNLNLSARAWLPNDDGNYCNNPITKNYGQQGIKLTHNLVAPTVAEGGKIGSISNLSFDYQPSVSANIVKQSVSEVGVFTFTATAPNYMDSNKSIAVSTTKNIGRFVPASFDLITNTTLGACTTTGEPSTNFTYFSQPFSSKITLEARNADNVRVNNYQGDFAKAKLLITAQDGNTLNFTSRVNGYETQAEQTPWLRGRKTVSLTPNIAREIATASNKQPKNSPVNQMQIGLIVDDQDGFMGKVQGEDLTLPNCTTEPCKARRLSTERFVQGRLVGENSYGSEHLDIPMVVKVQYWNGTNWIDHKADVCTRLNRSDINLKSQVNNPTLGYLFSPTLLNGQSIERGLTPFTASQTRFANGQSKLTWRANASSGVIKYTGEVVAPIPVPDYLKWYWQWDGVNDLKLHDPRSNVFFGRFRGHDRVIYWREVQ
ncbi:DUF6701 domain-containing protein [Parashewanella tropica]|uniref:DUF6701 domain-containing protein n=1 Tax=Parashewanella tropica TaxID=2547970 RepID=UPI00105981FC|nr:DUF6701 domain-containing protein [Parashewanella tropica]